MLLDLSGKKILVTGIANNRSIAWGIAQQLNAAGAELGITYLPDEKGRFEAKVKEPTEEGQILFHQISAAARQVSEDTLKPLSEKEKHVFMKLLDKLR